MNRCLSTAYRRGTSTGGHRSHGDACSGRGASGALTGRATLFSQRKKNSKTQGCRTQTGKGQIAQKQFPRGHCKHESAASTKCQTSQSGAAAPHRYLGQHASLAGALASALVGAGTDRVCRLACDAVILAPLQLPGVGVVNSGGALGPQVQGILDAVAEALQAPRQEAE